METTEKKSQDIPKGDLTVQLPRKAMAEMWSQWVEGEKQVWNIARISGNCFNWRERCQDITEKQGVTHSKSTDKAEAFIQQDIIRHPEETPHPPPVHGSKKRVDNFIMARPLRHLIRMTKMSVPSPDRITCRILNMV